MPGRVVLLLTSPRVAPGLLTGAAWDALRGGVVYAAANHPQLAHLREAGVAVEAIAPDLPPAEVAGVLRDRAAAGDPVVWLTGGREDEVARALGDAGVGADPVVGSYDLPGARLLDVVATMDRLRSPGGCPWDAEQTHESLAPYLLEEAYEAYEAIEERDLTGLREELGDVLLQVAFHARVAEERPAGERWGIDDVAAGLVDKLVRRHPHVFADREVSGAEEVSANWEVIKAEEKGRRSVTEGVALGQPALSLAATLQRKAAKVGLPPQLLSPDLAAAETPAQAVAAAAAGAEDHGGVDALGELLWAVVALARAQGVDPEAALRGRARRFRDRLHAVEHDLHDAGLDPRSLDERTWRERWSATGDDG